MTTEEQLNYEIEMCLQGILSEKDLINFIEMFVPKIIDRIKNSKQEERDRILDIIDKETKSEFGKSFEIERIINLI